LHPKALFNLFKTLKFVCDEWITPIKPEKLFTLNDQSEEENLKNLFKNFYHHCFYLSLNFIQSGAYNDKELNFFLNATFEKNSTIPDEELEIIFEKLSFFNKELPEAVEPANLFNDFVKDVDFFTDLTHKVIYFAEFCLKNQKIKNAESALRYCYLYMQDVDFYQDEPEELLVRLIYVSIMLGKYSQAIRYLEELKDLYLREEISWEYYAEVLTKYGRQIVQEDIKSISIDFNLIYELYNELKNLRDENRKLSETLSEYQSPETILKNFFGIFWDNLDEISKQNINSAPPCLMSRFSS
jgi:tetratricopeptide (TPR) repeat protein